MRPASEPSQTKPQSRVTLAHGAKRSWEEIHRAAREGIRPSLLELSQIYQVVLYLRIPTSQMDGRAVFCIICSPIRILLCKSELVVDGCSLSGCWAYVYLRSSVVPKTKRGASSSQRALSSAPAAHSQWSPLQTASSPGLGSPGVARLWKVMELGHRPFDREEMGLYEMPTTAYHKILKKEKPLTSEHFVQFFF